MVLKNSDYFRGSILGVLFGAFEGPIWVAFLSALFGSTWVGLF